MIINLTQHVATSAQKEAGVVEPPPGVKEKVKQLITFDEPPVFAEIKIRAAELVRIAQELEAEAAMIGGAPFLMGALETGLDIAGIRPLYAFSKRESEEQAQPDGSIRKVNVFRHVGFVETGA